MKGSQKPVDYNSKVFIDNKKNDIEASLVKEMKLNKYGFPKISDKYKVGLYYAKDNNTPQRIINGGLNNLYVNKENIGKYCSNNDDTLNNRIISLDKQLNTNPFVINLINKFN